MRRGGIPQKKTQPQGAAGATGQSFNTAAGATAKQGATASNFGA